MGNAAGDAIIKVLRDGKLSDFATAMDEPKGIAFTDDHLITTDRKRVWKVDREGNATVLVKETGSDYQRLSGRGTQGKVWRMDAEGNNKVLLAELQSAADFHLDEEENKLLVPDMLAGTILVVRLEDL